jgi:hypothetical protein
MSLGSMIGLALRLVQHYREIERLAPQVVKVATDVQRLMPQIQLVLGQAVELGAKIAPELMPATTAPAPDYDARWLQASLNDVLGINLVVDGIVGPRTRQAIEQFQKQHPPLVVDGWAGVQTMARLAEEVEKREAKVSR